MYVWLFCVLAIKVSCAIRINDDVDVLKNVPNLRATGYMYSQYGNHPPQVIYLTENSALNRPLKLPPSKPPTLPLPNESINNTKDFVQLANEYFRNRIYKKVTNASNDKYIPKKLTPNNEENGSELQRYELQPPPLAQPVPYENVIHLRKINKDAKPKYGFVVQMPRTKGMSANYQVVKVVPIRIFRNPFAVYRPVYRKIHLVPKNPSTPPIFIRPTTHKPKDSGDDSKKTHKKEEKDKKDENEEKEDEPEQDEEQEESSEDDEEKHDGKDNENKHHNSESNEEDESDEKSDEKESEEKTKRKVHKKYGEGDEKSEESEKHGHKSKKNHKKGSHNSNESGFEKTDGVKYNHENRARKGYESGKGYKNFDSFGKGKKGEYDEEHHSENEDAKNGHKAQSHDASKKHGSHHKQENGENGGKFNENKYHNRGNRTTGYHNVFHKDEYKKVHTFYDDADHRGSFKKYGKNHQKYDDNKGHQSDSDHHSSAHDIADHAKNANFRKGHHNQADKGFRKQYGNDNENSDEEQHSSRDHTREKKYRYRES